MLILRFLCCLRELAWWFKLDIVDFGDLCFVGQGFLEIDT